jgi:hypothetical protein
MIQRDEEEVGRERVGVADAGREGGRACAWPWSWRGRKIYIAVAGEKEMKGTLC